MVKPYTHPKHMNNPNAASHGELLVFRGTAVRDAVTGLDELLQSHSLSEELNLKEQTLFIPRYQTQMIVCAIVNLMTEAIENFENVRPMLANYIKTEMLDAEASSDAGSIGPEVAATLLEAMEHLIKQILSAYDITHSRDDGRHGYELLRLAHTGTLVICRFRLDY